MEQSVIVAQPESHSVEIQATKTHLFSADCTQTILFISCVWERVREREKCILKNWFDVDSQSQINMLTLQCSLSVHTYSQESVESKEMFAVYLFYLLCPSLFSSPPLNNVGFNAQLRACSFLIIQKRTVWNMLSSPGRKMAGRDKLWEYDSGNVMSLVITWTKKPTVKARFSFCCKEHEMYLQLKRKQEKHYVISYQRQDNPSLVLHSSI